jgi:hypothetical protein
MVRNKGSLRTWWGATIPCQRRTREGQRRRTQMADGFVGRCQGNAGFAHEAKRRLSSGDLRRKGAPLRQRGRASLLVDLPRDEMALLIELVVDLGVN